MQLPMCIYHLTIFTHCAHTLLSTHPILACALSSFSPGSTKSTTCVPQGHPFQTLRVESLCPHCNARRKEREKRIKEEGLIEGVKVEEWRWRVKYALPENVQREGEKKVEGLELELGKKREEDKGVKRGHEEDEDRKSGFKRLTGRKWRWKTGSWRDSLNASKNGKGEDGARERGLKGPEGWT
ncbi:MAG: hypothetical protein M1820_008754 [Bogoriella megaspora]|nr:MAG: hypothetical protein M1820_008754 [Bogoriella megaspora]